MWVKKARRGVVAGAAVSSMMGFAARSADQDDDDGEVRPVVARAAVVATGIPGAGAIAQVGTFHLGGPFHDNPTLAPATAPGQILDGRRLFVASSSNFGAPLGRADQAPGAVLSLDLSGGPVAVPPAFAAAGGQAGALAGRVLAFPANSPPFANRVFHPPAATPAP